MESKLLFSIRSYAGLKRDAAAIGSFEMGRSEVHVWKDGEIYQKVESPVHGREVVLIAGTGAETDTLEAFDLATALVEQGCRSLTIVLAFFGYATMERAWSPGEAVTAKSRARLWSSLPRAPSGNRIFILEPHTPGLVHYFGDRNNVAALNGAPLMLKMLSGIAVESPVLCSPDIGRIKWVDALASQSGWDSAYVLKRRGADGSVTAMGLTGNVAGRFVMLCDDMVRTGGTLINAARACLDAGAFRVAGAAIHGSFTQGTVAELESSGLLDSLICTDSHPVAYARPSNWLRVESCAGLIAESL